MTSETNRARALWVLAGVTAAYGLFNVFVFYTQDNFGAVWFTTSLLVYGALAAACIYMALVDTEARAVTTPAAHPTLQHLGEEVIYTTVTGRAIDARFRIDGAEKHILFAATADEVIPITGIEERLDEIELTVPAVRELRLVDEAIARREAEPEDEERAEDEEEAIA
jgi:hypothetical protein